MNAKLKKSLSNFFAMRESELITKSFKKINNAQNFGNRPLFKRKNKFFYIRIKKANTHICRYIGTLDHFGVIALLAVDNLQPFRGVGSFKFIRAVVVVVKVFGGVLVNSFVIFLARASTLAVPEFERISLFKPLIVTAIRTEPRQSQIHFSVKFKFLRNDFKTKSALFITLTFMLTTDYLIQDIVLHVFDVVWKIFGFDGYFYVFGFRVFPRISLLYCLFFG